MSRKVREGYIVEAFEIRKQPSDRSYGWILNLTFHDFLGSGKKSFCGGSRKGVPRIANSQGFNWKRGTLPSARLCKKRKKTDEKHLHLTSSRIDLLTLCLFGSLVVNVDVEMEISQEEERPKDLVSTQHMWFKNFTSILWWRFSINWYDNFEGSSSIVLAALERARNLVSCGE